MVNKTYHTRNKDKAVHEDVWLSKKALSEVGELLDLYEEEYPLRTPLKISKLCSMGLMMIGSLSTEELKNVDEWFRRQNY